MPDTEALQEHRRFVGEGAMRAVQLARGLLKERGMSNEEIDAALAQAYAPPNPPAKP